MRVEVETDQNHGAAMLRRFRLDARGIEVVEILDQWFGADYRYCKVNAPRAPRPASFATLP